MVRMVLLVFVSLQGLQVSKTLLYVTSHTVKSEVLGCDSLQYPSHGSQSSGFLSPCLILFSNFDLSFTQQTFNIYKVPPIPLRGESLGVM
jgi:hypothetical protein